MVSDPVFDSYQPKAIAAKSDGELRQILQEANERVARQHFSISLLQPTQYSLYQPWLKGTAVNSVRYVPLPAARSFFSSIRHVSGSTMTLKGPSGTDN